MAFKQIYFLKNLIPWFGNHTGYEQLLRFIPIEKRSHIIDPKHSILSRLIGKSVSLWKGWPPRNQHESYKEFLLAQKLLIHPLSKGHIMYLENHLPYFSFGQKVTERTIATIHQPPSFWRKEDFSYLSQVKRAFILYEKDLDFFSRYIPEIHFIHHGADIDFFKPSATLDLNLPKHLLFAGHHLRNIPMFRRVTEKMLSIRKDIIIDILVPERFRDHPDLRELKKYEAVKWHQKLSDEELRILFQKSYLLFAPMNDSGANTAIIDSLASGLPIVTTNVGGIQNYGGGVVYPLIDNNKDDDMVSLLLHYLENTSYRTNIARNCRDFAEITLNWQSIAQKHRDLY